MRREPYRRRLNDVGEMNLPAGKTCGDCVHVARCVTLFGHQADDEVCDWSPKTFREATQAPRKAEP